MKNNYTNLSTNLSIAVVKIWRRTWMIYFLFVCFIFPCRQNHLNLELSFFFFYNVVWWWFQRSVHPTAWGCRYKMSNECFSYPWRILKLFLFMRMVWLFTTKKKKKAQSSSSNGSHRVCFHAFVHTYKTESVLILGLSRFDLNRFSIRPIHAF